MHKIHSNLISESDLNKLLGTIISAVENIKY